MKLLTQDKNDVFGRTESVFQLSYSGSTPDRNSLKEEVSKQLKVKPDSLIIRKIETKFGKSEALVYVTSYKNKKDLETLELKHLISKNNKEVKKEETVEDVNEEKLAEEKEEVVKETPKEEVEKPAEEVKEEQKEETVEEVKEEEKAEEAVKEQND